MVFTSACFGEETNTFFADPNASTSSDAGSIDSGLDTTEADQGGDNGRHDGSRDFGADSDFAEGMDQSHVDLPDSDGDITIVDSTADVETDAGPDLTSPFSFTVFGDNQFSTSSCTSGAAVRMAVPEVVLDLDPTFALHTGDLMDHGYEDGAYSHFVDCYDGMLATIPFFPTSGNHDHGGGAITAYKTYLEEQLFERNPVVYGDGYESEFLVAYEDDETDWSTDRDHPSDRDLLPSGVTWKTYYAFQHENAYFISFEQGTRWWSQTPKPWLEDHLGAAHGDPEIDHIFIYMHHPMYSTTMAESADGECIEPVRGYYEALFRQYDVTMVFSGHAHNYDRFYVPDDGSPTRETATDMYTHDGTGVHYMVTGGGGGGLTGGCAPYPLRQEYSYQYSQARGCFHHVTEVEVHGGSLTVTIWQVEGSESDYSSTLADQFFIE